MIRYIMGRWALAFLAVALAVASIVVVRSEASATADKIEFCHAAGGHFNKIETSKAAFYQGHREHDGDIYPAGSYQNGNHVFSWPAQGDQSLLAYDDCVAPGSPEDPPAEFVPYEVSACWTMDAPDFVEGTYEFPQTLGCNPPACDTQVEQQHDTYWIRNEEKETAYAELLAGGVLNSPADDAPFEPHAYYSTVLTGDVCPTEPPTPTEPPVTEPPTPTEPPVTEPPTPTEPPLTEPPVTEPPTATPTPNPPRDCRENPVTCEEPPGKPTPTPSPTPPGRVCIDENTVKVTRSDGTVRFVTRAGICPRGDRPPAYEEGF